MKVQVKILFLKQEGDLPKLLSPIDTEEDALLETLRARLEQLYVFKRLRPFQRSFWDELPLLNPNPPVPTTFADFDVARRTCRSWKDALDSTIVHAALRLARWKVSRIPKPR
jgi:hypothetical protein